MQTVDSVPTLAPPTTTKADTHRLHRRFDPMGRVLRTELPQQPVDLHYDEDQGFHCVCPNENNDVHVCEDRSVIWGTAGFVTGTFGMTAASGVAQSLVEHSS